MKAFIVEKYNKNGPLRLADLPEPEVGLNDVLVRVEATAINLLDSKIRDGELKLFLPYRPPFILGHDLAGTVLRVGANVRAFKAGDEVYARPRDHRGPPIVDAAVHCDRCNRRKARSRTRPPFVATPAATPRDTRRGRCESGETECHSQ